MATKSIYWRDHEDFYIEENYDGPASIPAIAKHLGRTEFATERRAKLITINSPEKKRAAEILACDRHLEDLKRSGGHWA
jgi:hypothetical protein